jgi:glutathione synthase/RimK-type ligase-like ATP-grasp enzyme
LKTVALIGPAERPEIERLAIRLEERGGRAVVVDPARDDRIEIDGARLRAGGEDLSSVQAVSIIDLRLPPAMGPRDEAVFDPEAAALALRRSRRQLAAWNALFARLARLGRLVVNPPAAQELHALKPHEVAAYRRHGLDVPRTLATTDPAALAGLAGCGSLVVKPLAGGLAHTERFDPPASREEAGGRLAAGPVQAQELIEGDNIRVFVVAGEVIGAAEFIPLDGAEIDSRRGASRMSRVELPEAVAESAVTAARIAGMTFTGVDFMREEGTGRWALLECNSSPYFVGFEAATGIEVSGYLANHLLGIRRKR